LLDAGKHSTTYWLTPVKSHGNKSPEEIIRILVVERRVYAFGEKTSARKSLKLGDWICFYASRKGVFAHTRVASKVENRVLQGLPLEYSWSFRLEKVQAYVDNPTDLDLTMRQRLDAFRGRDLAKTWAWLVQTTRKISQHDFALLTKLDAA
jgi:hypothetical protein